MIEFKLPSLGADMDQGRLLEWKVKPGDRVTRGQVVAVVDTSKAAVDIESWQEGIVHTLVAQPEQMLPVGAVMALLLAEGEVPPPGAAVDVAATVAAAPGRQPAPVPATAAAPAVAGAESRQKVSPAARRHAAELGVDLAAITTASGPHGSITIEDVDRAAQQRHPAKPPGADRVGEMRKTIAAAMSRSKREIPHYYLAESIPLQCATRWLAEQNARRPMDARLLMAVVLLKAVALTLRQFPDLNGFYRDGAFQPSAAVHLGVAISLRQGGLIAPALHGADALTLEQLMRSLGDLVQRVRAGSLRSSELSDPSITVTNLGDQGAETVHGVIYPPQVALVGFGRISERPWAVGGALAVWPVVTASLAADHRVSDGHRGARFLVALREALQHPESL